MSRILSIAIAFIILPTIARAVCGDGALQTAAGEQCDPAIPGPYGTCCSSTCQRLDADDDGVCDDDDICTLTDAARLTEATLRVDRIAPPAGDERLRFTGRFRFPPSAFVDPAIGGFRFGLNAATSFFNLLPTVTPMITARIPGGAGWSTGNSTWRFRDPQGRYGGVTNVALKLITPAPVIPSDPKTTFAYTITARRGGYVVTPDMVQPYDFENELDAPWGQLQTKMALGSAADGSASCAWRPFPQNTYSFGFTLRPVLPCTQNRSGTTITCSTRKPIGPCRVGAPRDVVACEVLAVAAAEDAYKAKHGTYFETTFHEPCANLPGYTPTPGSGVGCSLYSTATSFSIVSAGSYAPAWTCMYDSTKTPGLDCF